MKKVFVGLIILSMFIPVVYADQLYPLLRTRTRISARTEGTSAKVTIKITAPFKWGCTPTRVVKWTLYKYDDYSGIWKWKKTGYLTGIKYYAVFTWKGLEWKAIKYKYFYGLNLGRYKVRLTSYDGCHYRKISGSTYFTITGR